MFWSLFKFTKGFHFGCLFLTPTHTVSQADVFHGSEDEPSATSVKEREIENPRSGVHVSTWRCLYSLKQGMRLRLKPIRRNLLGPPNLDTHTHTLHANLARGFLVYSPAFGWTWLFPHVVLQVSHRVWIGLVLWGS